MQQCQVGSCTHYPFPFNWVLNLFVAVVRFFTSFSIVTCIYAKASLGTVSRGVLFPRGSFLPWPLWFSTLHLMVGEIGADGHYVVCTSLPHFTLGRLGGGCSEFSWGKLKFVQWSSLQHLANHDLVLPRCFERPDSWSNLNPSRSGVV